MPESECRDLCIPPSADRWECQRPSSSTFVTQPRPHLGFQYYYMNLLLLPPPVSLSLPFSTNSMGCSTRPSILLHPLVLQLSQCIYSAAESVYTTSPHSPLAWLGHVNPSTHESNEGCEFRKIAFEQQNNTSGRYVTSSAAVKPLKCLQYDRL